MSSRRLLPAVLLIVNAACLPPFAQYAVRLFVQPSPVMRLVDLGQVEHVVRAGVRVAYVDDDRRVQRV